MRKGSGMICTIQHPLFIQVLSVTCQKSTALSGASLISGWTRSTVSSPRRWSALVPKIANVLGLDLPIVAKLCAGLQNVPHFKRKQPIILETDNLARRRHFFYYIKTIGVFIIWSKSWNKVFKKLLFSEHPWISGLQATIPPGFFKVL